VELGYDYCLKEECQQRCVKRVRLAAVGVNKAGDYYTTADEVLPPRAPAPPRGDPDDNPPIPPYASRPVANDDTKVPSTLDRLREKEAQLDRALRASYERFQRGDITAREMEHECDALVAAFNRHVMGENIRYRSMLRRRRDRRR
jgi:hypothetical protein